MTKQEQNVEAGRKFGEAINAAGIVERFFGYAISYLVVAFVYWTVLMVSEIHIEGYVSSFFLGFILPALPFFFWERGIRKFRRANGLSIYKNVKAELEQMEFNKMYEKEREMEEQARAAYEAKNKSDG